MSALTEDGILELVKHIIDFTEKNPRPRSEVRLYALDRQRMSRRLRGPGTGSRSYPSMGEDTGYFTTGWRRPSNTMTSARRKMSQDSPSFMRKYKVEELLEAAGAKRGDQITIGIRNSFSTPIIIPQTPETTDEEDPVEEAGPEED